MKEAPKYSRVVGIGDDAVKKATGKRWTEWFAILDKWKAKEKPHPEIARYLHGEQGLSGWWSQMVTVGYEQVRGMREKHETPTGYEISRSRTIAVAPARVFAAFVDARRRQAWLEDTAIKITKSTANKSIRASWIDGRTSLNINFYPRGEAKCQVAIQHSKLANAKEGEKMKRYWEKQLGTLKEVLEV